ncbi:Glycine amidinotransferase [Arthroderma uncinatum]|uniref:Glycine amidinotransferase n=1 Tax=Arthroderma uncinatum TaxID=74035 RepID=UPI00144A9C9E|nr:Glycine amidinotransferase [Arthroderma uncinatum]KAF3480431.1 Glycine amidinotransferase [Arthroderma uncinatum]
MSANSPLISADDEWSPLKAVIVGRAEHSAFPSEPFHAMAATMRKEHLAEFRPGNPFPPEVLEKAQQELDNFAAVLEQNGVRVYRPKEVDWLKVGGFTGAMPRDTFMTVGNTLIESPFPWRCRQKEVQLGYMDILDLLSSDYCARICRAPTIVGRDTIYDGVGGTNGNSETNGSHHWAINNSRPAFETADFMRFGKTIIAQISNVTNKKGIDYVQAMVPEGYTVEILETNEGFTTRHIDATILPLRKGLLVYSPPRVSEESLRSHAVFQDWELHPLPYTPQPEKNPWPPQYMCSPWLVLNGLSLDEKRIFVEEKNKEFADWIRDRFGMEPILLPFAHVNSIGGSFHCSTVDLVRSA